MNKCIINSTPPSVDSLNIATRRNENIIVSSALSVSHVVGVKRQKAIQQSIMTPFIWKEFKTRDNCFLQSGTQLLNNFFKCTFTDLHSCNDVFVPFYSFLFLLLYFLLACQQFIYVIVVGASAVYFTLQGTLNLFFEMYHISLLLLSLALLL